MSADLLRRAAEAMRERAEAAAPGPWEASKVYDEVYAIWPVPVMDADDPHNYPEECSRATRQNAEHIASWHPAVALAVADWLDYEAEQIGPLTTTEGRELTYVHGNPYAVTVARAFLGVES